MFLLGILLTLAVLVALPELTVSSTHAKVRSFFKNLGN